MMMRIWQKLEQLDGDQITRADVAAALSVSVGTVRNMEARGEILAAMKVGGRYRWQKDDIVEWAKSLER